jgi:UDP-N-acetylmuramate dehydrogenase
MLKILDNVLLKDFTTMRVGGLAKHFLVIKSLADLREAFSFVKTRKLPLLVLGGGSNTLISDHGFLGLVIKNEIKGIKFVDKNQAEVILEVGAGENLDEVIALSVIRKLSGLENLSGIPGTVGGAVVQNAGAYGAEIGNSIVSVSGLNSTNGKEFTFKTGDCQFTYRSSFFKNNKKYIITTVSFVLNKKAVTNVAYVGLKEVLANEKELTAEKVRNAVLKIRGEKLPDWHKVGTAGSYFKNPVISQAVLAKIKSEFPLVPNFPEPNNKVKIPLAWILDNICHLKGYKEGKVGLYEKQPLILVNLGGATFTEIINFANKIKKIVKEKTDIEIVEEVEKII